MKRLDWAYMILAAILLVAGCTEHHHYHTDTHTTIVKKAIEQPSTDHQGVLRICPENRNLMEVWCLNCKTKVGEIPKETGRFWWECPANPTTDHHRAVGSLCEAGKCPDCDEEACVATTIH